MSVIEDEILLNFLDRAAKAAIKEIKASGRLSEKNAIPLLLKAQFNHIAHLDRDMVRKEEFKKFKDDIQKEMATKSELKVLSHHIQNLEKQMTFGFKVIGGGITVLGLIIPIATIVITKMN